MSQLSSPTDPTRGETRSYHPLQTTVSSRDGNTQSIEEARLLVKVLHALVSWLFSFSFRFGQVELDACLSMRSVLFASRAHELVVLVSVGGHIGHYNLYLESLYIWQ